MEEEHASQVGRSLIKQLACCNKTTREKTLRLLLKSWLPSQSQPLSNDDAKKLWKGLFYCMWHSDKPLVQADLVDRLSSLLLSLHLPLSVQYFSIFLLTMRREWSGIDALRLDKFYLLIRRFVSKFFSLLKTNSWDLQLVESLMGVFDEGTLSAQENKAHGNGVNYHIATVFLEELRPFLPLKQQVLEVLLKPFISALGRVHDKVLVGKIRSGVFDLLLKNGKALLGVKKSGGEVVDSSDEVVVLGTVALTMGFSGRLYEMGSSAECWQGNRKVLYALHSEFLKLEKEAVKLGVEFSIPDVVDEEEVPELVPLGPAEVVGNGEVLKKCEKDKEVSVNGGESTERRRKKKKKGDSSDLASAEQSGKENVASENGDNANDGNAMVFSETVIANLQKQFEKVAEETGLDEEEAASVSDSPEVVSPTGKTVSKKRKRTKSLKGKASQDSADLNGVVGKESAVAKSGEKSAKKVRFSMKNNLVWKPHSPLPPQSLRLPPSATPRGSALKKGVPPGPIREMPPPTKKQKMKKARKAIKGVSPSVKRLKKLKLRAA
ncbi:ribosomal RNA processing protein 1 homolog isoform X1 [Vigna unguiculata]|uniref:Ribosomal RNA-processing protein 1 n=1 Tax=Vigna unguiculata TaxID=3917 RepID=A0A4D6KZG2_VIGUN|nr:ribosomal RNA processing protein 1 homolog isoform X1 [Vigna unguiculata]QCD80301.1 ribosomal RNA-processing protein 1 [Vigna unguiculata]